jgi:gentisate 1,2-dioxygenase
MHAHCITQRKTVSETSEETVELWKKAGRLEMSNPQHWVPPAHWRFKIIQKNTYLSRVLSSLEQCRGNLRITGSEVDSVWSVLEAAIRL